MIAQRVLHRDLVTVQDEQGEFILVNEAAAAQLELAVNAGQPPTPLDDRHAGCLELLRSGQPVELSALEFRLLHYMALHPGMVFSREQLLDSVWGNDRTVTPRSVDVYIRRIREKIELRSQQPMFVQTVHGVGYRFSTNGEES